MLKRSPLVFALALLLGLSGCGGSPSCTPFPIQQNTPAGMLMMGQPEELIIGPHLDYAGVCRGIQGTSITSAPSFFWGNVLGENFAYKGTRIRAVAPVP
jgi:hypothetical protein